MPYIYSGASLLVHVAKHEGFGLTLLEAFATRTPTLLSNIDVLKEVAKKAALYVDPKNAKEIAKNMSALINDSDLRNQLISKGSDRVNLFTWSNTADKLVKIIDNL